MPTVQLFVPCLAEEALPQVAEATARVLARAGCEVAYPQGQTCCGQLLYKSGHTHGARKAARHFLHVFTDLPGDLVAPSGSCVRMVRNYPELFPDDPTLVERFSALAARTYELCQYLVDVLGVTDLGARVSEPSDGRVAYHDSCQVGRALGIVSQPRALLRAVAGLELLELAPAERCCGFGGNMSLTLPDLAEAILTDKLAAIEQSGAATVTCAELSCLAHIKTGLARRGSAIQALHIAEILAGRGERA